MVVGDDISVGRDNHARAGTLFLRRLYSLLAGAALTSLPEEAKRVEKVTEGIFHFDGLRLRVLHHFHGDYRRKRLVCCISQIDGLTGSR